MPDTIIDTTTEQARELELAQSSTRIQVESLRVANEEELSNASGILVEIATRRKKTWDYLTKIKPDNVQDRYARWEEACEERKAAVGIFDKFRESVEKIMAAYITARNSRQQQEQRLIEKTYAEQSKTTLAQAEELIMEGRVKEGLALREQAASLSNVPVLATGGPALDGVRVDKDKITLDDIEIVDIEQLVLAAARPLIDKLLQPGERNPLAHVKAVPLRGTMKIKGKECDVCLFEVNKSWVKEKAKSMATRFNWPGIKVKPKMGFAVSTK